MLYDVASDERKLAKELKMAFVDLHSQLASTVPYHSRISHPWLMHSLYSNFQTSVVTESFQTLFITVGTVVSRGIA